MSFLSSILNTGTPKRVYPPKTAIFGDIHSNLEAFDAVLKDMKANDVTRFVCTGDVIGYGADPSACIQRLQELNALTVKGNHDEYCTGRYIPVEVNPFAREAILWTEKQLTPAESVWLLNLPMREQSEEISVAHSTFEPHRNWPYILTTLHAKASFNQQPTPLAFYGHTHQPTVFIQPESGPISKKQFKKIRIKKSCRYFINPGSVGQPRDGDPRAAYALYDPAKKTITLRRVTYDIETASKKILDAGLPVSNAKRLTIGK